VPHPHLFRAYWSPYQQWKWIKPMHYFLPHLSPVGHLYFLGHNFLFSILFSNTLISCHSLHVLNHTQNNTQHFIMPYVREKN
jgi:hypothetical protein